jgi:drug/metabolite transporter (DMT)-like permease
MTASPSLAGLAFALGSATFYGLNIGYARLASFAGVSGSALVVYRVLLMLALVTGVAITARRSIGVAPEERRAMGLLGFCTALIGVCYLSSVTYIPVTVAAVLFYTFPILIVLASPLVEGTRLTPTLLGIVMLALVGVVLVVGPAFDALDWRGIALALAASVATATQFFAASRTPRTSIVAKVFWIHVLVLPTATLIALATDSLAAPSALALAPYPVAMTIGGYLFGFVLQFLALNRVSAVAAGIIFCTEPVVAALSSTIILGETLDAVQYLGGLLVLAAVIANVLASPRPKHQPIVPLAD